MRAHRPWLVSAVLALGACPEDQTGDPLAADAVAAAARAGGDAEGDGWSGRYLLTRGPVDACDCPDDGLCELLLGGDRAVQLLHVDGYLTLTTAEGLANYGMSGAVFADGAVELAALVGLDTLVSDGSLYVRLSGALVGDSFAGELSARLAGTLPDGPVDCRASAELSGARWGG